MCSCCSCQPSHQLPDARVAKRPLLHPAIPSPYTSAETQKIVYIATKTPFLSAVKRVEKLLKLADKRAVQSATTRQKQNSRKRKGRNDDENDIEVIATIAEQEKARKTKDGTVEAVVIKGTGKAIDKVLSLALWFQQRDEYSIRMKTGTVAAIDDIVPGEESGLPPEVEATSKETSEQGQKSGEDDGLALEPSSADDANAGAEQQPDPTKSTDQDGGTEAVEPLPETRVRYTSVVEVAVSLR